METGREDRDFGLAEARRLLGVEVSMSSRRLRRLVEKVREVSPEGSRKTGGAWMRLEIEDIARVAIAIDLSGGMDALARGKRLRRLTTLFNACDALRRPPYLVNDPLLEVRMVRVGTSVLAEFDGVLLDPVSGQSALETTPSRADGLSSRVLAQAPAPLRSALGNLGRASTQPLA